MNLSINSNQKTARLAGLVYFLFAGMSIYSYMYVRQKIMIAGDMVASGKNIVANEFLYRTSIMADILSSILFVGVVLLLYQLLKPVHEFLAKFMVGIVIVAIPVSFIGEALRIAVLQIFKGNLLKSSSPPQVQDMAEILLKIDNYSGHFIAFHWGLWLIPLALLVYKSGFIPRIFAILLLLNGLGYMAGSATYILFPGAMATVSAIIYPTYFIGEIPLILWLLIKGVKFQKGQ